MRLRLMLVLALCAIATSARAETRTYVIAIGNNEPPSTSDSDEYLRALHYADDDAAAMFSFLKPLSAHSTLLTVLDEDTQRRFPDLAQLAQPPTLAELRRTIAWHKEQFEADRKHGDEPVLILFFSGHGSRAAGKPPALALLDGPLTQTILYDEVLAALPARYVHLLVDACYAEAVVRPRDLQADVVDVQPEDLQHYAARATLARFPNVGAIVATSSTAQSHEWDVYRHGVFTHEVLSGLRGAADVNRDRRIEYSELFAFLAAANREVSDERARLAVIARPPMANRRAPLVDLSLFRNAGRIVGAVGSLGWFVIEDSRGNRLADLRAERDYNVSLTLPAGEDLYLRNRTEEAQLHLARGDVVDLASLQLHPLTTNERGALESALQRGLFAAPFGPDYYRGFVDGKSDFVSVPLRGEARDDILISTAPVPRHRAAWATFGVAAGLGATAIVFAGLAGQALSDFDSTNLQRPASDARSRFNIYEPIAISAAIGSGVGTVVGAWLWIRLGRTSRTAPHVTAASRQPMRDPSADSARVVPASSPGGSN